MEKTVAARLMKLFLELDEPLNKATEIIGELPDQEEQVTMRRGIAEVGSRVYADLMLPIIRRYPDLDPEK